MKPIKSMKYKISQNIPALHLLFTEEDDVIVVRCLDFSISSHGQTIQEAIEAIKSSLVEYISHGIENKNIDNLLDPDLKEYWDLYMELEIEEEKRMFLDSFTSNNVTELQEGLTHA